VSSQQQCAWTGISDTRVVPVYISSSNAPVHGDIVESIYVLPEHRQQLLDFLSFVSRFRALFLTLLSIIILGIIGFEIAGSRALTGVSVLAIGPLLWIFPFANNVLFITKPRVQLTNVRASIRFIRALGVAAIALGVLLLAL